MKVKVSLREMRLMATLKSAYLTFPVHNMARRREGEGTKKKKSLGCLPPSPPPGTTPEPHRLDHFRDRAEEALEV